MNETIQFDYYYGIEAEQFSFYRVPWLLIKDERFKGLSSDAKLLYGLMLDRMSLSMKNGWLDDENRAYIIYTVDANFCKNLETVWCKNQVDRIGIQTFGVTPMERLCVNAKNIDISAFAGMESLKEIHIRGGVEHMSLGAFAMLPSIETICLEGIDPDVMEDDWANLGNSNLTILVPEDTSDEQLEAIGRKFLSSMIITDAAQVKRGTCSMPEDPMPDIAEILSAYGI